MRPVNLLPDGAGRRRSSGGMSGAAYAVVGVLAVLLVMTVAYTVVSNQVNSRKSEAAEAKAEADRLEAQAAALGPFANFTQIKQARLASVRELAAGRFDWERFVREVSHVLPRGSWLREADASALGDPSDSQAAAENGGKPTAILKGCTPAQPDVATLMVRLQRVHRVEDVALKESAIGENADAPSVDSCGSFYEFEISVTFTPTAPPEMPAGGGRVPASLGGGS